MRRSIGKKTACVFTIPMDIPVYPAIAPCTAFCPKIAQYIESCAFAAHPRTMYVGSMYFTSALISCLRRLQNHGPMSPSFGFPPASTPPAPWTYSCPAPSARTMIAWPWLSNSRFTCATTPVGPSIANGSSGMRHTSTLPFARLACNAMKPDCLPISFTTPTPFSALFASTAAAWIAFCASSTAVSNPNVLSMCRMSLSIVFGMPTTLTFNPLFAHSFETAFAPACVPLPPMTNTMLIPCDSMLSTIFGTSPPPRPHPMMLPPCCCNALVLFRDSGKFSTPSFQKPPKPNRIPLIFCTPYPTSNVVTTLRMTSFMPGHNPPQFTIAACTVGGSK
mmetsp:Transcript_2839/g.9213  ORF Transcript_2839/g.9213 Transcript_2839/m.9213 type:complete len:334 (+) Transcript_2839:5426-6427(+)|eukprot:30920-Pelagococcus_subviridis.AAC.4